MQKNNVIWILSILLFLLSSCSLGSQDIDIKDTTQAAWSQEENKNLTTEELKEENTQKAIENKIETIRKRLALKWLIIQWDAYYREGKNTLALSQYLKFYRENPEDNVILEKIGDTYFNMHKYISSYNYYSKIQNPNNDILDKIALSLVLDTNFKDIGNIKGQQIKLLSEIPSSDIQYYYTTSLECSIDFHKCKLDFWEYLFPEVWSEENQWESKKEIEYKKLLSIKSAIENYRNFQIDQVYLKDAYIVASWYSEGLYSLSAHMWEQILSYKPWYKPILKIVAQSYFEMGEYEKSREVLLKYQAVDDEDPAINYMLGIIYTEQDDYILGNIHLSKAIKLWSKESLEIRRQLIHNFYELDNQSNMLKEFQDLIENESEYTAQDLSLGIYNHILAKEYEIADSWSEMWKERFPDEAGNFYAYQAWILREKWDFLQAESILQQGLEKFPENPFILINLGYTALALEKKWSAVSYFKNIQVKYPDSQFAQQAEVELLNLSQK